MDLLLKQNMLLMIRAMYFCIEEKWSELGRKYNITPAQQHVLFLLSTSTSKTLAPTDISNFGCWHISTVTRLLKPLELKGLISISKDRNRPKFKEVKLTFAGDEILQELIKTVDQLNSFPCDLSHISDKEINNFLKCAQSILNVNRSESFCKWINQVTERGI